MRVPVIQGVIDRRILANYRVSAQTMERVLPPPFRPHLVNGYAIGGICLIRLKSIRPRFVPWAWGIGSENAAHRIAVQWDDGGVTRRGVYIPRRDTNSRLNAWLGGTVFPGLHHRAEFDVEENDREFYVALRSMDGQTSVTVSGKLSENFPSGSAFSSLDDASHFFEAGSLGYSETPSEGRYDGLELRCEEWKVLPLDVEQVKSSFFEDPKLFPAGTCEFDSALLMRGIHHQWHPRNDLCCNEL